VFEKENRPLTSHDVEDILEGKVVRSSVVRAINTLTKRGFLEKTSQKAVGKYGKLVYLWRMKEGQQQLI